MLFSVILSLFFVGNVLLVYGDGLTSETLSPSEVGNGNITLSIDSSPFPIDENHTGTQLNFVLVDIGKKSPVPEVTLSITASKGDKYLFDHVFKSDDGIFLINILPEPSGNITISETGITSSGASGHIGDYDVKIPIFISGGLYKFKIDILTMNSYNNQVNKSYDVGISIPETRQYQIYDKDYGKQTITIIAYYDNIDNFQYDSNKKTVNFVMPFNWTQNNISHVSVVHQELKIPKSFGDFLVTKYDCYVNGVKLPDSSVNVDDYSSNDRIIHLILYKKEIENIIKKQNISLPVMIFSLSPTSISSQMVPEFPSSHLFTLIVIFSSLILIPKFVGR